MPFIFMGLVLMGLSIFATGETEMAIGCVIGIVLMAAGVLSVFDPD